MYERIHTHKDTKRKLEVFFNCHTIRGEKNVFCKITIRKINTSSSNMKNFKLIK